MQGQILLGGVFPSDRPQFIQELKSHLTQRPDVIVWLLGPTAPNAVGVWASPEIPVAPDRVVQTDISSLHPLANLCQEYGFPILVQDRYSPARPAPAMQAVWRELASAGLGDVPWLVIFASHLQPDHHYRFGQLVKEALRRSGQKAVLLVEGTVSERQLAAAEDKVGRIIHEATARDLPLVMALGALKETPYSFMGKGDAAVFLLEASPGPMAGPTIGAETLPDLAIKAIETFLEHGQVPVADAATWARFPERRGTFVNLFLNGIWRGGVGNVHAPDVVAQSTILHAVFAASRDPRFEPLKPEELKNLTAQVLILGQPRMVRDIEQLDPKTHGLFVSSGYRFGLIMPNAEGVETPNQQIAAAMQKGGIAAGEPMWLYRFTVDQVEERATAPSSS